MIEGTKEMIAGCIERIRSQACGTCEGRWRCTAVRQESPTQREIAGRPGRAGSGRGRAALSFFLRELARAIDGQTASRKEAFRRRVERLLEPQLGSAPIRIDTVAHQLGCSRQTLYRRLKAEGVTFAEILDALRRRQAIEMVRDQGLSVKETAYRLGFSDPAAFSRAFKRWTGTSPRRARPELQSG
ncbi:AraC family transcriptional regulator [Sphingosinicella sp. CPCC 101087]|uniref:helix-turn-helix domain-containing protein n=1 Tax=Sphingosinicella sp. CPCC 101087 TaxID=2497754 RepID=UPI00101D8E76|nr:helix-turn-helix transcriptional regulator [Sphingosinicella sp. CPCC 101087]